ncbi:ATP-binding protein [Thiobacillus sp.]|uniref:sensor histidine kinase n=1 Tax=Thiobacillus sp. TaxID=924 RepID=UPI0011D81E50|nr:ATP-binding protein [Thiobacillus sp.]TXH72401.1 MAG: HAMP domain-containing protein [Thiobacillus sp.]
MLRFPFVYQLSLAPTVVIALLTGLIGYSLFGLAQIRHENEVVQQWVRITDRLHVAIGTGYRLQEITTRPRHYERAIPIFAPSEYLQQSAIFSENLLYPEVIYKMPSDLRALVEKEQAIINDHARFNPENANSALAVLMPRLEAFNSALWEGKRLAYANYYTNLNSVIADLVETSLYTLLACLFLAVILSAITVHSVRQRLGALALQARTLCSGNLVPVNAPPAVRDELDELTDCVANMTQRLLNVVAVEKFLQGVENERKRIAMDLHDQALADLTAVSRALEAAEKLPVTEQADQLAPLRGEVKNISASIRNIIDDLHPQTLDILGLEAATRSFLERNVARVPHWILRFEQETERTLTEFQRVNLFRIISESVSNVLRHAHATLCEITLHTVDGHIVLTIDDDGIGITTLTTSSTDRHGLSNLRQRARAMGATFNHGHSRFDTGTRLDFRWPLIQSERAGK